MVVVFFGDSGDRANGDSCDGSNYCCNGSLVSHCHIYLVATYLSPNAGGISKVLGAVILTFLTNPVGIIALASVFFCCCRRQSLRHTFSL